MDISNLPLFEKNSRSLPLLILYISVGIVLIAIDVRLQILDNFRNTIKGFFLPVILFSQDFTNSSKVLIEPHLKVGEINQKNQILQNENLLLQKKVEELLQIEKENESLRKIIDISKRSDVNLTTAEIVLHQAKQRIIIINKGENQGIRLGQSVISEVGVVGQVRVVYNNFSEVALITANNIKIPVRNISGKQTDFYGTIIGNGSNEVEFHNYPQGYNVNIGDILYTSGLANTFYAEYPVAIVNKIEASNLQSGVLVKARPIINPDNLIFVAVVTNKSNIADLLDEIGIISESIK